MLNEREREKIVMPISDGLLSMEIKDSDFLIQLISFQVSRSHPLSHPSLPNNCLSLLSTFVVQTTGVEKRNRQVWLKTKFDVRWFNCWTPDTRLSLCWALATCEGIQFDSLFLISRLPYLKYKSCEFQIGILFLLPKFHGVWRVLQWIVQNSHHNVMK